MQHDLPELDNRVMNFSSDPHQRRRKGKVPFVPAQAPKNILPNFSYISIDSKQPIKGGFQNAILV